MLLFNDSLHNNNHSPISSEIQSSGINEPGHWAEVMNI